MKLRLLPTFATAALGLAGWTALALSCGDDKDKTSQASAASVQACCASGAKTSAKATASHVGCPMSKDASVASMNAGSGACAHDKNAMATGHSGNCGGYGMAMAADAFSHSGCDACADMATCEEQLRTAKTVSQVVPLKNGIMYVFTADSPGHVRALQAAMARRNDRLTALAAAGDKVHLCPECKLMRGAVASGKLTREVVNIDGGCLTLMTSSDPSIVSRLHNMANSQTAVRTKM
jgi:hypothetical protein